MQDFAQKNLCMCNIFSTFAPDFVMYYKIGDIELNNSTHEVKRGDQAVNLTPLEFAILEYLMRHPNRVCTRTKLIDSVWGQRFQYDTGTIDVHLNALRRKLGLSRQRPIETVRGTGFVFHSENTDRPYSLTIRPFIIDWLQSHRGEFENKGLAPKLQLDPFVSEITMSPEQLRAMLDGILAALLPTAGKGFIRIVSKLSISHFSLLIDINGTTNELRIPITK